MLKKSHAVSIVGILLAVLFVFAGCEGPAGPSGLQGDDGSDVPFPGEITVTIPGGNNVPTLPAGVTYPPITGAKILSGSAADISKAFNGGILVANTPDSGEFDPAQSGTNGGTVYAQDAVDYVVWTGVGNPNLPQGSIVVPPGKTLFIAAPLPVAGGNGNFQGITVSDTGTFSPPGLASIQATVGGTTIDSINEGRIVLLNGGRIDGTTGPITIGGTLEIHHGAYIDVGGTTFLTTAKSTTNVYGGIIGGGTILNFEGDLTIKGGGLVSGSTGGYLSASDTYRGTVIVESYGELRLGNPGSNNMVNFHGPVTVQENASLLLNVAGGNDNPVTFRNVTEIGGALNAAGNQITVVPLSGHLKVTPTGTINATLWSQINGGNDVSLLAAIVPNAVPNAINKYTTISIPETGLVTLTVGQIEATTYANLRDLAASTRLNLPSGIAAATPTVTFNSSDPTLEVTTNDVYLTNYEIIGNVLVGEGKLLNMTGADLKTAGKITVLWSLNAPTATFETRLDSLNVGGDETVVPPVIVPVTLTLGGARFDAASPVITVYQDSKLTLGSGALNVNPAGTIDLKADAELTIAGNVSTLEKLQKLYIAAGAVFDSTDSNRTSFKALEELTVDGTLYADLTWANTNAYNDIFNFIQWNSNDSAGIGEVGGGGVAVFTGWNVSTTAPAIAPANKEHAFDQLLAIKDLTVNQVAGIANTSGTGATPDAGTSTGDGYILRVNRITVPGALTVDRDLNVLANGTINFSAVNNTLTIAAGKKILVGASAKPGLSAGTASAVLVAGGASVLTETTDALVASISTLTIQGGSTLNVDGKLTAGAAATAEIFAGAGLMSITLVESSLENGTILSNAVVSPATDAAAVITVNPSGTLTIGAASAVAKGSSLSVKAGGKVESTSTLTFGATGSYIGTGKLSAVTDSTILADATTDGKATISGSLTASEGATVLNSVTEDLVILGTVTLRNAGTSYDSVALANTTITGVSVFNADAANITLTGSLTGGTLFTKGSSGTLIIGTLVTLQAGASAGQSLTSVTLDGTAVSLVGSLNLVTDSVLTIPEAGTFNVTNGTLSVAGTGTTGGGRIVLGYTTSTAGSLVLAADTGTKGTLALGANPTVANSISGLSGGSASATDLAGVGAPGTALSTYNSPNITIAGTSAGDGTAGTSSKVTVASAGTVTISGNSAIGGSTISSSSAIYRLN
jgi:hypothetical protein